MCARTYVCVFVRVCKCVCACACACARAHVSAHMHVHICVCVCVSVCVCACVCAYVCVCICVRMCVLLCCVCLPPAIPPPHIRAFPINQQNRSPTPSPLCAIPIKEHILLLKDILPLKNTFSHSRTQSHVCGEHQWIHTSANVAMRGDCRVSSAGKIGGGKSQQSQQSCKNRGKQPSPESALWLFCLINSNQRTHFRIQKHKRKIGVKNRLLSQHYRVAYRHRMAFMYGFLYDTFIFKNTCWYSKTQSENRDKKSFSESALWMFGMMNSGVNWIGVATISRLLKMIGLFCKRAL